MTEMSLHLDATLSDPSDRLAYARALLHEPTPLATATPDATHPLSVLLFFLDGLAFLRLHTSAVAAAAAATASQSSDRASPSSAQRGGGATRGLGLGIALGRSDAGDETDVEDAALPVPPWERRAPIASAPAPVRAPHPRDSSDGITWDEWRNYVEEMYLYPSTPSTASAKSWTSPLHISTTVIPSLSCLCLDPTPGILRTCLLSCIFHLSTSTPASALITLLSEPEDFPTLLPAPVLHAMTTTLSTLRRRIARRRTMTFRSILDTLLEHHFPTAFGPAASLPRAPDADAIANYWGPPSPEPDADASDGEGEGGDGTNDVSLPHEATTSNHAASIRQMRKKEKLRWILGDTDGTPRSPDRPLPSASSSSFTSSRPHKQSSPPLSSTLSTFQPWSYSSSSLSGSPSPGKLLSRKTSRPVSMSSLESLNHSFMTSPSFSSTRIHRRGQSVSSSAPLLASSTSSSSSSFIFNPFPSSPSVPFTNFASRSSNGAGPAQTTTQTTTMSSTSSSASSSARTVRSLPPTTNALTASAKRDLVKRSRKLKQVFGVPLEEEAAGEVLVKTRRRSVPPSPSLFDPPPPSPRDDSFLLHPQHQHHHLHLHNHTYHSSRPAASALMSRGHTTPLSERSESYELERSLSAPTNSSSEAADRDERRRRVAKLQRVLGEQVPADLMLGRGAKGSPSASSTASGSGASIGTKSPSVVGGIVGGLWAMAGRRESSSSSLSSPMSTPGVGVGSKAFKSRKAGAHGGETTEPRDSVERGRMGEVDGRRAMAQARKVEQVLGAVPPRSFYIQTMAKNGHSRRQQSDPTTAGGRRDSIDSFLDISDDAVELGDEDEPVSPRSVDTYRSSIASLDYILKTNPAALDAFADDYSEKKNPHSVVAISSSLPHPVEHEVDLHLTDSDREVRERSKKKAGALQRAAVRTRGDSDESAFDSTLLDAHEDSTVEEGEDALRLDDDVLLDRRPAVAFETAAMGAHRKTVRTAMKLATLLGTTRGDVWVKLLADLQLAAQHDPDLDEEERAEVLMGITRLRQTSM